MIRELPIPDGKYVHVDLYRKLDEVVHYVWDPIGVAGIPQARDEYYSYLPKVYDLVLIGDKSKLKEHLNKLAYVNMGLSDLCETRTEEAVSAMLAWKDECDDA